MLLQEVLSGDHAGAIGQIALCHSKSENQEDGGSSNDWVPFNSARLTVLRSDNFINIQSVMVSVGLAAENDSLRDFFRFKQNRELSVKVAEMFDFVRVPKLTSLLCDKLS